MVLILDPTVRYKDTGELAIVWNNLGLNVPLKEFMEV